MLFYNRGIKLFELLSYYTFFRVRQIKTTKRFLPLRPEGEFNIIRAVFSRGETLIFP